MLDQARVVAVVSEVEERCPGFFEENAVTVSDEDIGGALREALPAADVAALDELRAAIRSASEARGVRCDGVSADSDPLAQELLRGIADACRADVAVEVQPAPTAGGVEAVLTSDYTPIADAAGTPCGHIRKRGGSPLLLLSALGLPLDIWSWLLRGDHEHQVIVPVLPSCDLLAGGMTCTMSATQVAEKLQELLSILDRPAVDVLAWCNGGRIGAELLRLAGDTVGELVLLSPTFRGGVTASARTSEYEDNLEKMFVLATGGPKRADRVAAMLRRSQPDPDWQTLAEQPAERAAALFGMPRRRFDADMKVPMATADSLLHYVERTRLDEALTAELSGGLPGERVTLVQGSHDFIVDNVQTNEWLEEHAPGFTAYEISGAGHYIQDLQYGYLAYLLHRILIDPDAGGELPARIRMVRPVGDVW